MGKFDVIRKKIRRKRIKIHIFYLVVLLFLSFIFVYRYDNIQQSFNKIIHWHEKSEKNLNQKIDNYSSYLDSLPFGSPFDTIIIASDYGWRHDPFSEQRVFHDGIDLTANFKEPVRATANGQVIFAQYFGSYGFCIIIKHSVGYESLYAHLYKITLKDSLIQKGDTIGLCGSTGRSTGVHLHYEIIKDGKKINPYDYLKYY